MKIMDQPPSPKEARQFSTLPLSPAQALSETFRKRAANWFDQALVTRLNDRKKGVIVLVMHRLHLEDLTGHLLCKPRNIWHHVCLPIIAEDKEIIYSVNNHIPEHEQEIL